MQPQKPIATPPSLKDLFFAPFGCLFTASPYLLIGVFAVLVLFGYFVYSNFNLDLFGLGAPDFQNWSIDPGFERVQIGDQVWTIQYESHIHSTFTGLVRHVSPIREGNFPFLTHDILITSGEFADPQKVSTSVTNHHFSWFSKDHPHPQGRINLLHAVPLDEEIYQKLLSIQVGATVSISGREILKIDRLDAQGKPEFWWEDTGCNSLLVTSVEMK